MCRPYTLAVSARQASGCYKRLFSFGDSISDAGNLGIVNPNISALAFPYGETFFHRPTGRCSDGRLIVDFVAEELRLPFLKPFLAGKTVEDFRQGVNFAVAGATALSQQFFGDMGLDVSSIPPFSLDVQVECFKRVLHMLGPTEQERKEIMSSSLLIVGEIGGNDYNHPFFQNRSFSAEIKPLVPKVIEKIENAIKTIVVPGNFPIGCVPTYLTLFQSYNPSDYDAFGCIRWLNDFAEEHNRALQLMLERIVPRNDPTVTVAYGDYYGAVLEITRSPQKHGRYHHHIAYVKFFVLQAGKDHTIYICIKQLAGFRKDVVLTACCGDCTSHKPGNATSIHLCPDPSKHISWDGLHFTEAAYKFVARGILDRPYAAVVHPIQMQIQTKPLGLLHYKAYI
ncbi:hypothetical protein HU200_011039 [Digitaria exilis]|uniref:Uncharacterized protein n=1 Tax=Digitaria exilis TaxID=1010633 RepID=A0A835FIM8_9POAL|nr:hypothetical protein HU200_011039 [Digitaria exilis]